jgi:hypothetical protein
MVALLALAFCLHTTAAPAWGIVVSDDPSLHVITAPSSYDGVARISSTQGSSAVLIEPWYILTAKHAVAAWSGHTATFYLAGGPVVYSMAEVFTHPTADIAVVRLNRDTGMDGYSLYDPNVYGSEIGKEGILLGYGMSGTPDTVQAGGDPNYPRGTLRIGYNRIDAIDPSYGTRGQCLRMDFDSPSTGGPFGSLGADKEAMIALGDSGAPVFFEAGGSLRVAGITVAIAPFDPNHWPKYGDYGYAVRVSAYTSWIESVMADIPAPLTGDFNNDSFVNTTDIDALFNRYGSSDLWYDVSGDSVVGWADSDTLIRTMLASEYGDANLDQKVDLDDYNILVANFNKVGGWAKGDFNGDYRVTFADYQVLEAAFGFGTGGSLAPPPVPIPEPVTLTLLALGALGLVRRER